MGPAGRAADRGSMTVEVAFLLVLLVVPLFYLVGTLARLQAGAYAVSAAAREAGRAFVTADRAEAAHGRGAAAAGLVLAAHGFTTGEVRLTMACSAGCLQPGSTVRVDATLAVELPLVPDFVADRVPARVELSSSHLEPVDEFREGP